MGIPSDADVTATTFVALLDHAALDGGDPVSTSVAEIFADWRDTGAVPLRRKPGWLPESSGAYLTWLAYHDPPDLTIPNDVDLVVNANVVYALARLGETSTPGFAESVALINMVVERSIHRAQFETITDYYPDSYVFDYCVSRAFSEGPVPGLEPAAAILASDIADEAIPLWDGTVYWDKGDPALNTAFAILTLLNARGDPELVDRGVQYLVNTQDPVRGAWGEGVFFLAHTDGGPAVEWTSEALTTALVLEALGRHKLQ